MATKVTLTESQLKKSKELQAKFVAKLDSKLKFWVKDTRKEGSKLLDFDSNASVEDMKKKIQLEFGYRENEKLRLLFRGQELRIGTSLFDYEIIEKEQEKWAKPYSGVLWIVPRHIAAPSHKTFYT